MDFWEITSGFIPVFSAIWFDSGYMCLSSRCVSFVVFRPDALHHGRFGLEGQLCGEMVVVILVITQRQIPMSYSFLGCGPDVQKTVAFHSCISCLVVHMPVVVHDRFWWCRRCSSHRWSSTSCLYAEADVPVEWPCRSSVAALEGTAAIPPLQLVVLCLDKVIHTPVVCNDVCLVVQSAVNCDGCAVAVL